MDRRHLIITGGILVLGLVAAFPLTWVFSESGASRRQSQVGSTGYGPAVHRRDASGTEWAITPAGGRVAVPDSNGTQAKPGIVVKTEVFQAGGREVRIGLILAGRDGQRYQPVVTKGGVRQPAPTLQIVNEAGKVVVDDRFQYG